MVDTSTDEQRPHSRRNPVAAIVRFLLHWIIKVFVLLFMVARFVLRPRAVRYGLIALLVLGFAGFKYLEGTAPTTRAAGTTPQTAAVLSTSAAPAASQLPQSPVIQDYLRAQAAFNAPAMWEALSDELKQSMGDAATSIQDLQEQLNTARDSGSRFRSANYVGGVPLSDGRTAYFYVLTLDGSRGAQDVPYIYVTDEGGKILSIQ